MKLIKSIFLLCCKKGEVDFVGEVGRVFWWRGFGRMEDRNIGRWRREGCLGEAFVVEDYRVRLGS